MAKKILLLTIVIVCLLFVLYYSKEKNEYLKVNNTKIAISDGNGGVLNSIPNKGPYKVTVNCTNAEGMWDYSNWEIVLKNITENAICTLDFKEITKQYFANFIKSDYDEKPNVGTNGILIQENGYRYEGINPNNYVLFNNELWRIIGVFNTEYDTTGNGTTNSNNMLVKIIRTDSIGAYLWNNTLNNSWPDSSLNHILNIDYYNWNVNNSSSGSYCYKSRYYNDLKCDFSITGLKENYRNMIVKAKWYLGGPGKEGYTNYDPDSLYSYERNTDSLYTDLPAYSVDYVGLMYSSDYAYSTPNTTCTRGNYSLYLSDLTTGYRNSVCAGNSWLYGVGNEWFITNFNSSNSAVLGLHDGGYADNQAVNCGFQVRPVVYLSPDVYLIEGTGTITDPYIISM